MLYFINSLAKTWNWNKNLSSRQNLERIIREKVPSNIRIHAGIKQWLLKIIKPCKYIYLIILAELNETRPRINFISIIVSIPANTI